MQLHWVLVATGGPGCLILCSCWRDRTPLAPVFIYSYFYLKYIVIDHFVCFLNRILLSRKNKKKVVQHRWSYLHHPSKKLRVKVVAPTLVKDLQPWGWTSDHGSESTTGRAKGTTWGHGSFSRVHRQPRGATINFGKVKKNKVISPLISFFSCISNWVNFYVLYMAIHSTKCWYHTTCWFPVDIALNRWHFKAFYYIADFLGGIN